MELVRVEILSSKSLLPFLSYSPTPSDLTAYSSDLTFLATPPPSLSAFAPLFLSTLIMIRSLVKDFETNFVYVKGFDSYIVQVSFLIQSASSEVR